MLFLFSGALSAEKTIYYPIMFSLMSVFILYFYFLEDMVSFYMALFFLCTNLVIKVTLSHEFSYLLLLLVIAIVVFFCAFDFVIWRSRSQLSTDKRDKSLEEIQGLKEKFESKEESVKRLEQQVADIANLFEMAKEFNQCLYYSELVEVVIQKVLSEVHFEKALLVLFDDELNVNTSFSINGSEASYQQNNEIVENCLEVRIANYLSKKPYITRWDTDKDIDAQSEIIGENTKFPFWIFPLFVEEKIIAAFVVENAQVDDYPKFEIVSAQLALQVKKVKLYETVKELSILDGLTQVFVRRHFLERFQEELKRSIKYKFELCVLMLDIDHFKQYNDSFGHLVGDVTLKQVASLIKEAVRRVDIIARYGGEEFIVVLPETTKKGGEEVAERIRSTIAKKRFHLYDEETQVTVSIGASSFPHDLKAAGEIQEFDKDQMLELLSCADQALYKAKEEGRNQVVVYNPN